MMTWGRMAGLIGPRLRGTIAVEMHQIRYFLAVCETLNFTRAAEACNVSQPSLTRAIKGLEDELGGPLFRRERNNTHLTGLGEMMRPHLSQVLIETDAAKERAKSLGELDIAVYGQPEEIDERFHARRLYDERFVIGVGPGHPFDKQNVVRVQDLHDQAYCNRLQCEYFGHAGRIFREHGGKPRIVFRSDRDDWVQSMAMAGMGFTFI